MEMSSFHRLDADRRGQLSAPINLAHSPDVVIGGVAVRPSTREIVCGDVIHVVEPRVMQVLVALARADGAILSRYDLTCSCWENRIVGEDAINRVISRLRHLAENCAGAFRIETITKVGYRLIQNGAAVGPASNAPTTSDSALGSLRRILPIAGAAGLILTAVGLAGSSWQRHQAPAITKPSEAVPGAIDPGSEAEAVPADPGTAALYLKARADWARETADSIDAAIREFGAVIARDPSYAPAYAGLADTYIVSRGFGARYNAVAVPRAKAAALVALRIDPDQPAALRALGFVQYWGDRQPRAAGASFRKAIALSPSNAQSHSWYANALADNGDVSDAIHEFNLARAIDPQSIEIQADWAWALWQIGEHDQAVQALTTIERNNPSFSGVRWYLEAIYLADHDYRRELEELTILASRSSETDFRNRTAEENAAFVRGGVQALKKLQMADADTARSEPFGDLAWPAFVASAFGDRAVLLSLLQSADARGERWGSAAGVAQIARAWASDAVILKLLKRRRARSIA
ncbi:hypothetical protein EAH79_13250 [Sphingomonas koreensis]|nr:hypothetical protein EAH79_13250 [Sphingomonas koreensis]